MISDGGEGVSMEIHTFYEHSGDKWWSVMAVRASRWKYTQTMSTAATNENQWWLWERLDGNAHRLWAQRQQMMMSDGCEGISMEIRTSYEPSGNKWWSVMAVRVSRWKYALSISTAATNNDQWWQWERLDGNTHRLWAQRRQIMISDGCESVSMDIRTDYEHRGDKW